MSESQVGPVYMKPVLPGMQATSSLSSCTHEALCQVSDYNQLRNLDLDHTQSLDLDIEKYPDNSLNQSKHT